ncbi:hypothetical protein BDZ89DRAFT_1067698 [Hymenopellis radicata]|nr:hypothetical protein BDZ89DRAFT_1067698 [Hymenopellis radicata]
MLHYRLVLSHSGIKYRLLNIIHSFPIAHASHQRRGLLLTRFGLRAQRRSMSENRPLKALGECTFAGLPLRRLVDVVHTPEHGTFRVMTLPLLQAPRQDD